MVWNIRLLSTLLQGDQLLQCGNRVIHPWIGGHLLLRATSGWLYLLHQCAQCLEVTRGQITTTENKVDTFRFKNGFVFHGVLK